MKTESSESQWANSPVANLVRYVPSGIYFARARVSGKLIRRSLKTDVLSVAQLRLSDLLKAERQAVESRASVSRGKMTFGDALGIYGSRLEAKVELKPSAKLYRQKCIEALVRSWPGLRELDVRKVSERECMNWAARFGAKYSASVYNNTVGTLRHVLDISIAEGARYGNPAMIVKKAKIRPKPLTLPEQGQFLALIQSVESAGAWCSQDCADLVRFLAFGGFRKGEAETITWADCDFEKGEVVVRGDPVTGTKNWSIRRVPMIPDMRELLERLRAECPTDPPENPVMRVQECQGAINTACKKLGIPRFTHHDLRHLFATRCIESGVDIPTVSRWLGHKDGGALAMKVYGHLRDQHSVSMAQKVSFAKLAEDKIVYMPKAG
ncbi:MAG: site-specific integrase [Verrucomicrobiota bacterium]|jgi:integrase